MLYLHVGPFEWAARKIKHPLGCPADVACSTTDAEPQSPVLSRSLGWVAVPRPALEMRSKAACVSADNSQHRSQGAVTHLHRMLEQGRHELFVGGALAVGQLHSLRRLLQLVGQVVAPVAAALLVQQHGVRQRHQHSLRAQADPQLPLKRADTPLSRVAGPGRPDAPRLDLKGYSFVPRSKGQCDAVCMAAQVAESCQAQHASMYVLSTSKALV